MMTTLPTPGLRSRLLTPLNPVSLGDAQRRTAHMAAAVLLAYPDDAARATAPTVQAALAGLPAAVRERLEPLAAAIADADDDALRALQADYVATFDLKRKCALYLTYYRAGDTRRRGHALVRFVEAYRAAGFELDSEELPDYLPTVLELSAQAQGEGAKVAAALLAAHREGIEVLRSALAQLTSPWTAVVEAVCLTLGPVDEATAERVAELVLAGPPAELVGLSGYGASDSEGGSPWM
ncbi:nitrate reductase molybdenum cofactor assembly chaperone [Xylanimonas cellulosilytica DSM 15894]|uniref:Nitrate reductase molybdenum cofactor assembly chaperone n=1 Tax=Xylanimonas cellulosilytica (strain DSM 15894 / JCM 12276 / CECT 5975 / KCTC 9989 / LMG 20990 / NBRC 107835 / XIL07) TaxID=446471 RepID=D1BT04_XYLCX|nr:nitrate reductase molybdenum cofactor assembly chaperone [Xylanimonas cellulosilytica]ACZ30846.1 nitrate reductase molybdenum cofactor assembly chaperone [Xylanimonas cellulosilytica DSM 15894]